MRNARGWKHFSSLLFYFFLYPFFVSTHLSFNFSDNPCWYSSRCEVLCESNGICSVLVLVVTHVIEPIFDDKNIIISLAG